MKNEINKQAPQELTDEQLQQVTGGINPKLNKKSEPTQELDKEHLSW